MDGEIRIQTQVKFRSIYKDLKEAQIIKDFHELFFVCACLGYVNNKKKPLGKDSEDRFRSTNLTSDEWAVYYAMAIESNENSWNSFREEKEILRQIEEFANAGMDILIEEFLHDFLTHENEEPQIIPSYKEELPKRFLSYLFVKTKNEG